MVNRFTSNHRNCKGHLLPVFFLPVMQPKPTKACINVFVLRGRPLNCLYEYLSNAKFKKVVRFIRWQGLVMMVFYCWDGITSSRWCAVNMVGLCLRSRGCALLRCVRNYFGCLLDCVLWWAGHCGRLVFFACGSLWIAGLDQTCLPCSNIPDFFFHKLFFTPFRNLLKSVQICLFFFWKASCLPTLRKNAVKFCCFWQFISKYIWYHFRLVESMFIFE